MRPCPICNCHDIVTSVSRPQLPVLQNKVYSTREAALRSPTAPFLLGTCRRCGFSFNALFQPKLVVYDETYNNEAPSPVFFRYCEKIAEMLIDRFRLTSGTVYDVGCGKGAFLRILCRLAPGIQGVGIDPSCSPLCEANCTLVRDVFRPEHVKDDAKLVLLRHVLEHMDDPVTFTSALGKALPDVPLFVELPDLSWIFRNEVFWDFCYEHCNYFSGTSLTYALNRAGFWVEERQTSFGDQYQWAICIPKGNDAAEVPSGPDEVIAAQAYHAQEEARLDLVRKMVDEARNLVLWGMATKGVVLSNLIGSDRIAGSVDINPSKQGRYVASSGIEIHAPEWLQTFAGEATVLIMNPNYADEIRERILSMGIQPRIGVA